MIEASKYRLLVTAGPTYDHSSHQLVPVNLNKPIHLKSDHIDAKVNVRVQNYHGLPSHSPTTSTYFQHAPHEHDLYSIDFSFKLLDDSIPGTDLLWGNDFDHPIRDRLPPGFNTAFRIVKWMIDPGLDGDVYVEEPYLYGPLLSSINTLRVGASAGSEHGRKEDESDEKHSEAVAEGGEGDGEALRKEHEVPSEGPKRMKHFLDEQHKAKWTFEKGREYRCDFFNPYLDFNEFSLKLPGFTLPIIKYWDRQPLRYVLKRKSSTNKEDKGKELLVVLFTLIPAEKAEEEEAKWVSSGNADAAKAATGKKVGGGDAAEDDHAKGEGDKGSEEKDEKFVDDDVD